MWRRTILGGQRTPDPVADDANLDGPSGYVKGRLSTPVM